MGQKLVVFGVVNVPEIEKTEKKAVKMREKKKLIVLAHISPLRLSNNNYKLLGYDVTYCG